MLLLDTVHDQENDRFLIFGKRSFPFLLLIHSLECTRSRIFESWKEVSPKNSLRDGSDVNSNIPLWCLIRLIHSLREVRTWTPIPLLGWWLIRLIHIQKCSPATDVGFNNKRGSFEDFEGSTRFYRVIPRHSACELSVSRRKYNSRMKDTIRYLPCIVVLLTILIK